MTSEKISEKISPSNLSGLLSSRVLPALFGNETSLLCEQKKEEKRLRERPDFANYVPFKAKRECRNTVRFTDLCLIHLLVQK